MFDDQIRLNLAFWINQLEGAADDRFAKLDSSDRQNIFRAIQYGIRLAATRPESAKLGQLFFNVVERRGYYREWLPLLQKIIATCTSHDLRLRGRLLNQLGILQRNDNIQAAIAVHQEAAALAESSGNRAAVVEAYFHLANDYLQISALTQAIEYGLLAHQQFSQDSAEAKWQAATLDLLGQIAAKQGLYQQAETYYIEAIERLRPGQEFTMLVRSLNNLANCYQYAAKTAEALKAYEEASQILSLTHNELDKIMVQISLGSLYFNLGRIAEADEVFNECNKNEILRRFASPMIQATFYNNLGNVKLKQEALPQAEEYLTQSIELYRKIGYEIYLANSLLTQAEVVNRLGYPQRAQALCQEAIVLLQKHPGDAFARYLIEKTGGQGFCHSS